MGKQPQKGPKRSDGSDLPRPRKSSNSDLPRPVKRTGNHSNDAGTNGRAQAAGRKQRTGEKRRTYGSDTMEFRAPREEAMPYEAYEEEYEYRRAAMEQQRPARRRQAAAKPPKRKKPRKKNVFLRILQGAVLLAAAVFFVYSAAALFLIGRLEKVEGGERTVTSGTLEESYVTNILLIGTDARDAAVENGRSDSMIMLSINSRSRTIYLTSFMRDAYVEIPGHGGAKLNAAYAYGGADLLMDTLEYNYHISIDDYMAVSFTGFAGIIDAFGGVEITLSDAEAQALNEILISEVNALMGDDRNADLLESGGTYVLNGKQALSYSRIRYVGNADFERTSRQREVMTQLFGKVKTNAVGAVPGLVSTALPQMATNMSTGEMYLLSLRVPIAAGYEIAQIQVPAEGTWSSDTVDGQSVLRVDFEANAQILQDTVYAASGQEAS